VKLRDHRYRRVGQAVQLLEQYGVNVVTVPPDPVAPAPCPPRFNHIQAYDIQSAALFQMETSH
jgi:hypothetical protein